jgi:hypothetical protein
VAAISTVWRSKCAATSACVAVSNVPVSSLEPFRYILRRSPVSLLTGISPKR